MARFTYPARSFTFHAKRGQHQQVADLLKSHLIQFVEPNDYYGHSCIEPRMSDTPEGVMVTVKMPEGVSKSSVNKMLYAAGVPGASSRRKHTPWLKIKDVRMREDGRIHFTGDQSVLRELCEKGWYEKPFRISVDGKIRRAVITYLIDCFLVMGFSELTPTDRRLIRLHNRREAEARKQATV